MNASKDYKIIKDKCRLCPNAFYRYAITNVPAATDVGNNPVASRDSGEELCVECRETVIAVIQDSMNSQARWDLGLELRSLCITKENENYLHKLIIRRHAERRVRKDNYGKHFYELTDKYYEDEYGYRYK